MKAMKLLAVLLVASFALASHAAEKSYRLKFGHHNPPNSFVSANGFETWAKTIETRSNGQIKIDLYPSSMLGKAQDNYDNVINGVMDITYTVASYYQGRFPLAEVLNQPMLGIDKAGLGSKVIWDIYQNTPWLKKEFSDVKMLALHTHDGAPITSRMEIKSVADMAGKKIRVAGGPIVTYIQAMGASPMMMPAPDTYQAAEKGVIDGAVLPWEAVEMINLQEVQKYALDASLYVGVHLMVMNKKLFESMPPELQKIIDEESGDKLSQLLSRAWDDTKKVSTDKFVARAGNKFATIDPAEFPKWQEKAKPIRDKWVADLSAKGLPAKEILEYALKKIEEFKKQ